MTMRKTGKLCEKHGGTCDPRDAGWLCDKCAIMGYEPCKCGGNARGFGEAMFSCAGCEECDESVFGIDVDVKSLWNKGIRGSVK
jgi:hypothetical protein